MMIKTNEKYERNYELILDTVACKNKKPLSCFSGGAPLANMDGMSVAEFVADPIAGVAAAQRTIKRIEEDAGPLASANTLPGALNMVFSITMLWCSKVLIPGIEIPEDSVWQVKEQKLIGRDAYDKILEMGYNNFIQSEIMPKIIDPEYMQKYAKINAENAQAVTQSWIDMGIVMMRSGLSTMIPFEQLCGMRSMTNFFMDCYKIPDKIKEVSDFIFEETSKAKAKELEAVKDNKYILGYWVGGWRTASAMLNPKIWEDLVWPYMKAATEQLLEYGKLPIIHLDQDWNRDIERFSELPTGKIVLNTDSMTDLPNARKKLPGYSLMGDVPPTLLTAGTPEDVSEYVKRLIDEVGPEGLFVCPGCDCPVGAKYENVVAMIKTTNEWQ